MDPRNEIIRVWLGEDNRPTGNPFDRIDSLLTRLDAHAAAQHSADEVERVAKAIALNVLEQAREMGEEGTADYEDLPDKGTESEPGKDTFRRMAIAALSAMPPRDDAERFVEAVRKAVKAAEQDADPMESFCEISDALNDLDDARKDAHGQKNAG